MPTATAPPLLREFELSAYRAEAERYHSDRGYRESLPCSECGAVGGCEHFPKEDEEDA